jgi:hypothetical protein
MAIALRSKTMYRTLNYCHYKAASGCIGRVRGNLNRKLDQNQTSNIWIKCLAYLGRGHLDKSRGSDSIDVAGNFAILDDTTGPSFDIIRNCHQTKRVRLKPRSDCVGYVHRRIEQRTQREQRRTPTHHNEPTCIMTSC